MIETLYACARLRAIFVPLNARMLATELCMFVHQARPAVLLAEQSLEPAAEAMRPELSRMFRIGTHNQWGPGRVQARSEWRPLTPVLIASTPGTTGLPKGGLVTNHSLVLGALKMMVDRALTSDDEVLLASPLFHVAGLLSLGLPVLWAGAALTIHRQFDADSVLNDIQYFGITRFMST